MPGAALEGRGFGVVNGDPVDRDGEDNVRGIGPGEDGTDGCRIPGVRIGVASLPLLNSFAVMDAYLDALEPEVMTLLCTAGCLAEAVGVAAAAFEVARMRATRAVGVSGP